jgi:4,5:9,10-diseco-3-hydroxy-5,9,17-trioxoandrosta-1(10),2-diene-4-oate hydrolase
MEIETHEATVDGMRTRYLAAGSGPPLVLVHGDGESAADWQWVLPTFARSYRVLAPDLPGCGPTVEPVARCTPEFFGGFLGGFLDALGIERAVLVGNSLGALAILHLVLRDPERAAALVLVDSAGLGREVNPAQQLLTLPGYGEMQAAWARTFPGSTQRILARSALLFARPERVPLGWVREQYRLASLPQFLDVTLASLRELMDVGGQRPDQILLHRLPELEMPTLVVWGAQDLVVPVSHGREAVARLRNGHLAVIPDCGHQPQVECPSQFVDTLDGFLDVERHPRPRRARRVREEPS